MVNYRFYCECGHSGLEEIARTQIGKEPTFKSGVMQTAYFLCEGCNSIYQSTRYGYSGSKQPGTAATIGEFEHFSAYRGGLSWEQIMANAEKFLGKITMQDEFNILEPVKAKKR